ncbi:MAG TPA: SPOR domain-containing protein [Gammaproteobacteria bacterium]
MSRDYKHTAVFSTGTRPLPFWFWLFAIAAISGFAGLIYYLDQYERAKTIAQTVDAAATRDVSKGAQLHSQVQIQEQHQAPYQEQAQPQPQAQSQTQPQTQAADENKSRFDFYKLLPSLSVDIAKGVDAVKGVGVEKTVDEAKSEPAQPKPSPSLTSNPAELATSINYLLQAGSFKDFQEADRLKANLALMGIQANIEKVTLNHSEVWHRVRIGPLASEREMHKIRNRLREGNIEPITLKVKG